MRWRIRVVCHGNQGDLLIEWKATLGECNDVIAECLAQSRFDV